VLDLNQRPKDHEDGLIGLVIRRSLAPCCGIVYHRDSLRLGSAAGEWGMRPGVRGETSARAVHFVYDALADMHKTVLS
jgi:hypothetical protein